MKAFLAYREVGDTINLIEVVTLDEVNKLARQLLIPDNKQIFAVGDVTKATLCKAIGI